VCLDGYVSNEVKANRRLKRGGGIASVSLDFDGAESEIARAGAALWESPEECFDREWRRHVFTLSIEAVRDELAANGKASWFALFARYDLGDAGQRPTYEQLARDAGVPVTTVTNQLAFVPRELRRLVLANIEQITTNSDEFRSEARALLGNDTA
jgi:hypothetical protein